MNRKQKAYEYKDPISKILKYRQSMHHNQNLSQIKNRNMTRNKSCINTFIPSVKSQPSLMSYYDKSQNDSRFDKKLGEIASKKSKPSINDKFLSIEQNKKIIMKIREQTNNKVMQQKNLDFYKRIHLSQSFLSAKKLDEEFNSSHQKLIKKLCKVKEGDYLFPRIHNRSLSPSAFEIMKNSSQTNRTPHIMPSINS